jgi:hypothetical protein
MPVFEFSFPINAEAGFSSDCVHRDNLYSFASQMVKRAEDFGAFLVLPPSL